MTRTQHDPQAARPASLPDMLSRSLRSLRGQKEVGALVMSQCQQILQVLSDGREHEMRDIHRRVGFCRLNSRIAELRSRGHEITCRRTGGSYFYKLEAASGPSPVASFASAPNPAAATDADGTPAGRDGAGVLTLFPGPAKTW